MPAQKGFSQLLVVFIILTLGLIAFLILSGARNSLLSKPSNLSPVSENHQEQPKFNIKSEYQNPFRQIEKQQYVNPFENLK